MGLLVQNVEYVGFFDSSWTPGTCEGQMREFAATVSPESGWRAATNHGKAHVRMPDSVFSPLFKSSSNIVTFKPEKYRNGNWPLSAGAEDLWRATSDGSNRSNQSHPTALAASDATPKPGEHCQCSCKPFSSCNRMGATENTVEKKQKVLQIFKDPIIQEKTFRSLCTSDAIQMSPNHPDHFSQCYISISNHSLQPIPDPQLEGL